MASSMFLPTCQQCQDSGAGSDACQDRHKAEGNQTVCRYIKPSSANTHITIIPASGPLQATTATATDADHDKVRLTLGVGMRARQLLCRLQPHVS
jgi:hypothetical protein